VVLSVLALMTACTAAPTPSASGSPAAQASSGAATATGGVGTGVGTVAADKTLNFIAVMPSPLSQPNFNSTNVAFQMAAKAMNATVKYTSPPSNLIDVKTILQLLRDAQAQKPDGIFISDEFPDAMDDTIKEVIASGIPIIFTVNGRASVAKTGALSFIGRDFVQAGRIAGEQFNKIGCQNLFAVALIKGGAPYSDLTMQGVTEAFKGPKLSLANLPVSFTNDIPGTSGAVNAALIKDPTIDCVFAAGATLYAAMAGGLLNLGARTQQLQSRSGGGQATEGNLQDLVDGKLSFVVNGQQFNSGWMAVAAMVSYVRYGMAPPPDMSVAGGLVTKETAAKTLDLLRKTGIL
jgi:simple sugar transport system substrate-binding protein